MPSFSSFSLRSLAAVCLPAFALLTSLLAPAYSSAQDLARRALDHKDYDVWNTISQRQISRDGQWIVYSLQSGAIDGESTLHIRHSGSQKEYVVERGSGVRLTHDSRFAIFRVTPSQKLIKKLRKAKTKSEDMPKSKLHILELDSGEAITLEGVRSFGLPEENSDWVACLMESDGADAKIDQSKSAIRESYEVTPQGLRRPKKKLQLKSREELLREREAVAEETIEEEQAEESEGEEEESSEGEKEEDAEDKDKRDGTPLLLINLETEVQRSFPFVTEYEFSKDGKVLAFATSVPDDGESEKEENDKQAQDDSNSQADAEAEADTDDEPVDGVHVFDLGELELASVIDGVGEYKNLSLNEDGSKLAFITSRDDWESKTSTWAVYQWTSEEEEATKIAAEGKRGMPRDWWVSPNSSQRYAEDGSRLYFETAPIPDSVTEEREEADHDEEEDDKVKLDIWHWQDPQLQPQQLLQAEFERRRDYEAAYVFESKEVVQLETRMLPDLRIDLESKSPKSVANTNVRYRKMLSWDMPGYQDAYLVDLNTGEAEVILEKIKSRVSLSPEGKYVTWFDAEQRKWFSKATENVDGEPVEISAGIPFPLQDELHDTPNLPRSYGDEGWVTGDSGFLVYDKYDLWLLDPTGESEPRCLTQGLGRESEISFRYATLDSDERAIDLGKPLILRAFNRVTKASGFYRLVVADSEQEETDSEESDDAEEEEASSSDGAAAHSLVQLMMLDESVSGLSKAEDSDEVMFVRNTFRMCPDIWSSTVEFKRIHRVSDSNPQQDDYLWGDAELVHWDATDGQKLDGILLKPDGFDPSKKYPMIVYFYERNSDNLHSYYPPAAGRSIICHSFYVSRGYLVFIPDIPYKTGEPGPSAVNAILPGVEHLVTQGYVDEERIGTQGHSWGGYQTAYLVTQTDMFACAESGAPVSNMTSAYGGIRWGSGMSRMFQYERTQSRIGQDLWSARDKYLANSPLFFADKVNTPLLILHNDEDGAVPWYQGIELFVALRRLEKPAWMLNYNGNPHWVMGDYNRRDFAKRMQQFFDHYLKDAPEPEWMAYGVPAVDKGENYGFELLEPAQEPDEEPAAEEAEASEEVAAEASEE